MIRHSDGTPRRDPATAPLPYVRGKTKTWIIGGVSFVHAAMIVVPIIFLSIMSLFNPPLLVMNIPIVDSLPNENQIMSPYPAPGRPFSTGTPDYGDPKDLTDIPDVPSLPPKGEPKAEPEGGPAPDEPKPVKEKTEPEKTKEPSKPETAEKETPPDGADKSQPALKATKKPPKYRSASEIKISKKVVKLPATQASGGGAGNKSGRGTGTSNAQSGSPDGDANRREIGNMIRSLTGTPGGRGIPGGGGGPKGVLSKDISEYYNSVEAFLKRRWDQPHIEMLNRTSPKVIVRFKVDSDGRLLSALIISKSGVNAMDASVQALISSLKVLPPPPMAMEFLVTLEIDR